MESLSCLAESSWDSYHSRFAALYVHYSLVDGVSWPMNNETISFQSTKHDVWYLLQEKTRPNEPESSICTLALNPLWRVLKNHALVLAFISLTEGLSYQSDNKVWFSQVLLIAACTSLTSLPSMPRGSSHPTGTLPGQQNCCHPASAASCSMRLAVVELRHGLH